MMKITIRTSSGPTCELQVGTTHHPYLGPLPEVGQPLDIPEHALVEPQAQGRAKVTKIIWHYGPESTTLWPEVVCRMSRRSRASRKPC